MKEDLFKTVSRNSSILALMFKTAVVTVSFIVSVTLFFGDIKGLPSKVASLEGRVAALELNYATSMAEIKLLLSKIETDLNIFKVEVTRQGMEREKFLTTGQRNVIIQSKEER